MFDPTLIVALEALLIFGGVAVFGYWQLRSIKKDQEKAKAKRESENNDQP